MTQLHALAGQINKSARATGCLIAVATVLALVALLTYVVMRLGGAELALVLILPDLVVAGLVGFIIQRIVQTRLAAGRRESLARRLSEPSLTISAAALRPGDSVDVSYVQKVLESLEVRDAKFELVRRVSEADLFYGAREWDRVKQSVRQPGGDFHPGSSLLWTVELEMPGDAGKTLVERVFHRNLDWLICVRLELSPKPDFVAEFRLPIQLEEE